MHQLITMIISMKNGTLNWILSLIQRGKRIILTNYKAQGNVSLTQVSHLSYYPPSLCLFFSLSWKCQSSCAILHLPKFVQWQGSRLRSYIAGLLAAPAGPACRSSCAYINTNWDIFTCHESCVKAQVTEQWMNFFSKNGYLKMGF